MKPLLRAVQLWNAPAAAIAAWDTSPRKQRHETLVADWVGEIGSVADLGCGSARYAAILDCRYYYGFDSSPQMLAHASAQVFEWDIFKGPPDTHDYDVIISIGVAIHLTEPIAALEFILERWSARRYILSLAVGDVREDLFLSTIVPFSQYLSFIDKINVTRTYIERYEKERFAWVLVEVIS